MKNTNELLQVIQSNKDRIKRFGVKKIGIFGSFARNEQRPDSDVDFIVEFESGRKNFDSYMELCFFLEDILQMKVDVLTPEGIDPLMKPGIEKEAVYERL
ncbi:MAG: nucleotidyltransferase family protein [Brevinematales bacterium]|nr:nucleotidyltransferase family protein [Brevinematales bacterium]